MGHPGRRSGDFDLSAAKQLTHHNSVLPGGPLTLESHENSATASFFATFRMILARSQTTWARNPSENAEDFAAHFGEWITG